MVNDITDSNSTKNLTKAIYKICDGLSISFLHKYVKISEQTPTYKATKED